jgi:hypothetical protein
VGLNGWLVGSGSVQFGFPSINLHHTMLPLKLLIFGQQVLLHFLHLLLDLNRFIKLLDVAKACV